MIMATHVVDDGAARQQHTARQGKEQDKCHFTEAIKKVKHSELSTTLLFLIETAVKFKNRSRENIGKDLA